MSHKIFKPLSILLFLFIPFIVLSNNNLHKPKISEGPHVHGKPFLILGGETSNSAATSVDDIINLMPIVASMNLNTVLIPAYWDLTEPDEDRFDFSLTDAIIEQARENGLKVIFLWFGAWKNSMSCYTPTWFKKDTARFPRACTKDGKSLEIASVFSTDVLKADKKAFEKWLSHITHTDIDSTVVMIQIENEVGMLEDARDYSPLAQKFYQEGVPMVLTQYLQTNIDNLAPDIKNRWIENGSKMSGSWENVFGKGLETDEFFMAWYYAKYIEEMAKTARKYTEIPLYVNAALNSRDRRPGEYPSAGPLAHLKDIWKAAAPTLDFMSPDIYDPGFESWISQYDFTGNRLFIPEIRMSSNNAAQAYYAFGHNNAIGFSPFSIENASTEIQQSIKESYNLLNQLGDLLTRRSDYEFTDGFLLSQENPNDTITDGDVRIIISHYYTLPWDPRAKSVNPWPYAGGIIIKIAPEEYIIAGNGIVAKFENIEDRSAQRELGEDGFIIQGSIESDNNNQYTKQRMGLLSVEEIAIGNNGSFNRMRSFNGDETHQGRHVRISIDDHKILHVKTYRYQ